LTTRDLVAAAWVVVIWGLNFVAMKFGLRDFTPFQLGAARFLFATFPLAFWVKPPKIPLPWLVLYGLVQVAQFAFLFVALAVGMTAALASVLMQTQVFFTAVFGVVLLHERVGRPLKLGMAIAALGLSCFAISIWIHPGATAVTAPGLVLNLLAASMWAASNIVVRRIQATGARYDALPLVVWSSAVACASFLLISLVFDDPATRWRWTRAPLGGWASIAYLGWVSTAIAYGLWTTLLKRHLAIRVAPFGLAVPAVGLLAGMVLLGERVTNWQWAGAALVISALVFVIAGSTPRGVRTDAAAPANSPTRSP
jgi:O-acetylserine/cysteine efflux transporter